MQFILKTKLHKPKLYKKKVFRSALIEKLNSGLQKKLVLVVAPAGYGKSTLISQWTVDNKNSVWFSIDENDNDIVRFLSYFLSTIQQFNKEVVEPSFEILKSQPQNLPTEYILGELINNLDSFEEELFIVLDDYHLISNKEIHEALNFFLANMPQNVHLVIGSRSDPPLMLARLRSFGQLIEMRAKELAFSIEETADFFSTVGLGINKETLEKLDQRIEGWVAGLQMLSISLEEKKDIDSYIDSLSANNQYILDYLVEEIFNQQSKEIRDFLMHTSILSRFNASLCNYLNHFEDAEQMLLYLKKRNLFVVPLDDERNWYRFHHLFADLLFHRLKKNSPGQIQELHTRAAIWYQKEREIAESIEHYLKANAFQQAEKLISNVAENYWVEGEHPTIKRWTKAFPKEFEFSPKLCFVLAAIYILEGNYGKADRIVESLKISPEERDDPQIKGITCALKAYIKNYQGNILETEKYGKEALALLDEKNALWKCLAGLAVGDMYVQKGPLEPATDCYIDAFRSGNYIGINYCNTLVQHRLVVMYHRRGMLNHASRLILEYSSKNPGAYQSGALSLIEGELLLEYNDLDKAEVKFIKALELCKKQLHIAALPYCLMLLSKIYFAKGETEKSIKNINESITILEEYDMPPWVVSFVMSWKVQLDIEFNNFDVAKAYFNKRDIHLEGELYYSVFTDYVVYARYLIAIKEFNNASILLERLIKKLTEIDWQELALRSKLLLVFLKYNAGNEQKAISILKEVLSFAEPQNYARTILDHWEYIKDIIQMIKEQGSFLEYIDKLTRFSKQIHLEQIQKSDTALIDPLSDRELDVLKLFQTRLTNSEIADKLYISVNTVKTHIKNIYFKLDVNSKRQAIEKAIELDLI